MKKIVYSLIGLLLMAACASPQQDNNSIIVGLECNYAPFNWTSPSQESDVAVMISEQGAGYCDGYDIQVASALAEGLNKTLVVKKIAWEGLIPALNAGEIDMIVAGMTDTPDRRQSVSFSKPYYASTDIVLIVRKDSPFTSGTSLADFDGARVIAQKGTVHDEIVEEIPNVNHLTPLSSFPLLANSVLLGEADAMVSEYPVAQSIVASNPDLSIVVFNEGQGFEPITVSVALRLSDSDLESQINSILDTLSDTTRTTWMEEATARQPE